MPHSVSPELSAEVVLMADWHTAEADTMDRNREHDVPVNDEDNQDDPIEARSPETANAKGDKKDVKLEDLFADMDSDDEFPSSKDDGLGSSSAEEPTFSDLVESTSMKASDPEIMRSFYQRLFPWRYLFQWLNHSPTPTNDFGHREFAFTLERDGKEIYSRYNSYATADLLRKDVLRLMPSRFEIGPVYTSNPRDKKTLRNVSAFKPVAKELCFDIDLTDYDEIRTCCDKANICEKCWEFMTMAIQVIDTALRDDFGFKHIMWVYSGRRGVHAWVCDEKARKLDDQKRRATAGYLEVIRGGAQSGKKVNVRRPLHPHLQRSFDILKTHFQEDVLETQNPWDSAERAEKLLRLLPDRNLCDSLRKKWNSAPGRASKSKWADIDTVAKTGASKSLDSKALLEAKQDIVLEYTYPRLDIEVSKKLNHLLKSPFVVHPGTGRVCVPIDVKALEDFDPLHVPTVQDLLREIDSWQAPEADASNVRSIQDWEKTSLKPYIDYFRAFVLALMKDERDPKVKREREEADSMEF